MPFDRFKPADLLFRLLLWAGCLGLIAVTVQDRGASLMYAAPWSLAYWLAVLAPALLLLLRLRPDARPFHLPAGPWRGLLAAGWATVLVAALISPYRESAVRWAAVPLAGLAVLLLVHDWLRADPANRSRLAGTAAFAAGTLMLATTGYWVADLLSLTRAELFSVRLFEMRNPHPLGHANYTAGLALLSLPWLVQAAVRRRGSLGGLAAVGAGLALLALFTSGSRGGLLGLAALGVTALAATRPNWRRFALMGGAVVVAAGTLAIANPRIRALLGHGDPHSPPNVSTVQRQAMLAAGLRLGADRPLLGWGLHTTPLAFPRYRAELAGGAENVLQLHCTPVELWAGLGSAGLLLLAGFVALAAGAWRRAPTAAAALAGYGVFALTDYQLDVPVFALALAALAAELASPDARAAPPRTKAGLAVAVLATLGAVAWWGGGDPAPALNLEALARARDPAQAPRAVALLQQSLALNPDQEIAHFNLGWLLVRSDPAAAAQHFRAAAQLVPDKGGVYFGLGLARLNQDQPASAAHAFALECLNEPRFLASPWWNEPAIAAERAATQAAFVRLATRARAALPPGSWAEQQAGLVLGLAPRLGSVSPGPELSYRRERTGYPVLMRNQDLATPRDLLDVREDPRFPASVPFALPPKGWLPSPLLLKLLDEAPSSGH